MPLPLPTLDDRTFADLVAEMRSLIPRYDKTWTNHNPSDPGITLLELFAWLAELAIYRMDQISERTQLVFLDLMGVQPAGPQTVLTFVINLGKRDLRPDEFAIPRHTRVAARHEKTDALLIFETTTEVRYHEDNWDEDQSLWVYQAPAVNTFEVRAELLGVSSGTPHQEFPLQRGPLYLDREYEAFDCNPQITLRGAGVDSVWQYRSDLLTAAPDAPVFTVDQLAGSIRFGDGQHGNIPPAGAKISCTYRRLGGKDTEVAAGKINTILDPPRGVAASALSVFNEAPVTGIDPEGLEDLLTRGLSLLQERSRAISLEDCEQLAREAAPALVARVKAVAYRNLEGPKATELAPGHVSLIILPHREVLGRPAEMKRLKRQVFHYLDERRLITTIIHVVAPEFTPLALEIGLQAKAGIAPPNLAARVKEALETFLDPYRGWEDGQGWPFCRPVYRSELYQRLEAVDGVNYVTELKMNGNAETSLIEVGENRLVRLDDLRVEVTVEGAP